jgi:methylglutaconyl-CoA hydratase
VLRRLADGDARELMLTGERFDAEAAKRVGLVQHVAAPDDLDGMVTERVGLLLAGGPQAQARIKALLERWEGAARAEYRAALPRILAEARTSDEAQEGLAAALENRTPGWARDV